MYAIRTYFWKCGPPCFVARCVANCVNGGVRVVRARFYGVETCSPCCAYPHYCVVELQVLIFGRIYVAPAKSSRSSNIDVSWQYARAQRKDSFEATSEWSKKYGGIFVMWLRPGMYVSFFRNL